MPFCIGWVKNFDEITLSCTVKEKEANFCFSIFGKKFKNSKWPPFLGRGKFFENCQEYISYIPCGSKISTKSLYLARLRRYANLCFSIFDKNSNIQNGRHMWEEENFLKIAKSTLLRYPVSRKVR